MPIELCPRCKRLHYVPGECPPTRQVGRASIANPDAQIERIKVIETLELGVLVEHSALQQRKRGRPPTGYDKKAAGRKRLADKRRAKDKAK